MGAFIIAGLVFAGTLLACFFIVMANGMSDAPSVQGISPLPTLVGGGVLAALVLASHWLPHIGW